MRPITLDEFQFGLRENRVYIRYAPGGTEEVTFIKYYFDELIGIGMARFDKEDVSIDIDSVDFEQMDYYDAEF
jgi:hypothetical protein